MNPRENPYADNFASSKLLFNTTNAFDRSMNIVQAWTQVCRYSSK